LSLNKNYKKKFKWKYAALHVFSFPVKCVVDRMVVIITLC